MEYLLNDFLTNLRHTSRTLRSAWLVVPLLGLVACGGGSGGNKGGGNSPPTANAGVDQTVAELGVVQLAGSGTDVNAGDTLRYSWVQTAGTTVTISNGSTAQASFTAPDVTAGAPEMLTFQLTVSDGKANATDTVAITVEEPTGTVTVSGTVNYEFVPPNANCSGLNFGATTPRPIRGATVLLLAAGGAEIDRTVSDNAGGYAFSNVEVNTMVRLRVRAELMRQGSPSWDVEVRNNVDTSPSPVLLASRPMYVIDGSDFDVGSTNITRTLTAETGWDGSSYANPRAAAPFAILDAIYSGIQFISSAEPSANFPPLDVFWSVNNTSTSPTDIDAGELGTSFYRSDIDSLFLLGDANDDTEEFDDHVIVHEWSHYFEDNFSRSDSIGGPHSVGQRIDPRLAFGEGWASALAAMALGDQLYCDTGAAGTSAGFGIGAESGSYDARGWYDEISVLRFIYDLWDNNDEGGDAGSIGFTPIHNVMTGPQAFTDAFTTVFSFASELRATLPLADQAFLDTQLAREDMTAADLDVWGTNELNDSGGAPDVMPIYTEIVPDGTPLEICSNSQFDLRVDPISGDRVRDGNKLSEYRYLRMNVTAQSRYRIVIDTINPVSVPPIGFDCSDPLNVDDPNIHMHSDPDLLVLRNGDIAAAGTACEANNETTDTTTLGMGIHVLAINEFRYADPDSPQNYPDKTCFNITVSQIP